STVAPPPLPNPPKLSISRCNPTRSTLGTVDPGSTPRDRPAGDVGPTQPPRTTARTNSNVPLRIAQCGAGKPRKTNADRRRKPLVGSIPLVVPSPEPQRSKRNGSSPRGQRS